MNCYITKLLITENSLSPSIIPAAQTFTMASHSVKPWVTDCVNF